MQVAVKWAGLFHDKLIHAETKEDTDTYSVMQAVSRWQFM